MTTIMIHRCPVCPHIGELADAVAESLRDDRGTTVDVVDGQEGELRVDVDDANAYSHDGTILPTADEVVTAVHEAEALGDRR